MHATLLTAPAVAPVHAATIYVLDGDDRIRGVGGGWDSFATANGAAELAGDALVGRSLWDCIAGPEVRELYRALFDRVRSRGRTVDVPFRCDAPDRRRHMQLRVQPISGASLEGLELIASLERSVPRDMVELHHGQGPRGELLVMCSWCKRLRLDEWCDIEDAATKHGVLLGPELPPITHGMCPGCQESILASLEG